MAQRPGPLDAAVALSPPDSSHVLDLQSAGTYAPRGILFVADSRERPNAENLADGAQNSDVWEAPVAGHGYELLAVREVRRRLNGWLAGTLRLAG